MKKFFLFASVTAAFLIPACGANKTPSSNTKSEVPASVVTKSQTSSDSSISYVSEQASLIVDASKKILFVTYNNVSSEECVIEKNNATWKNIPYPNIVDTVKYGFRGDTLILNNLFGEEFQYNMYMGGTAGKIYGTWKRIPCYWSNVDNNTNCKNPVGDNEELSINISKDKVVFNSKRATGQEKNEINKDFEGKELNMHSSFMTSVYEVLLGKQTDFSFEFDQMSHAIGLVTDSTYLDIDRRIRIIGGSKTKGTFSIDNKKYTVKINKGQFSEYDFMEDVDIEVSDGMNKCRVQYTAMFPNKALCNSENIKYFQTTEKESIDGHKYKTASIYKKTNEKEFFKCISGIAPVAVITPDDAQRLKERESEELRVWMEKHPHP